MGTVYRVEATTWKLLLGSLGFLLEEHEVDFQINYRRAVVWHRGKPALKFPRALAVLAVKTGKTNERAVYERDVKGWLKASTMLADLKREHDAYYANMDPQKLAELLEERVKAWRKAEERQTAAFVAYREAHEATAEAAAMLVAIYGRRIFTLPGDELAVRAVIYKHPYPFVRLDETKNDPRPGLVMDPGAIRAVSLDEEDQEAETGLDADEAEDVEEVEATPAEVRVELRRLGVGPTLELVKSSSRVAIGRSSAKV